tara:strand:- start:1020 stop:1958 length:939 start_codon:yes stop_codon:yes gene_type:complete
MSKLFGVNLNYDSLGEAYGWPKDYVDDKAYSKGLERISKLTNKLKIPLTIFVIGKDLENINNFNILKNFCENNDVEIANHSYNHLFNFGSCSENIIYDEIYRSHEIIFKCTKQEPKGFISPTWSVSKKVIKSLIKLNYKYDTSFFKSFYLYPMIAKICLSHLIGRKYSKALKIFSRSDYFVPFNFRNKPFYLDENMKIFDSYKNNTLLEFPMPSINNFSTPIWNTVGFVFGWKFLEKKLKKILSRNENFFYLIHPADFLDSDDLDNRYSLSLERMQKYKAAEKISYLEDVFNLIIQSGYKGEKIKNIAKSYQ